MAEFPAMPLWTDAQLIRTALVNDGWQSPDTYCKFYRSIIEGSAIYLFMIYDNKTFNDALVAYVGMSADLKQRLSGHEVLQELNVPDYWTMTWFKPTSLGRLRVTELTYIRRFNPPWNIIGRQRGVSLQ